MQALRSCALHCLVYAIAVGGRPGGIECVYVVYMRSRDLVFHRRARSHSTTGEVSVPAARLGHMQPPPTAGVCE